jgi:hypothetical protein
VIARIAGHRGPGFVALHLDVRASGGSEIWVPIRGDRGRSGEVSWRRAARMCARALRVQIDRVYDGAQALHQLCDRRRPRTSEEDQRIVHLAREVFDLVRATRGNAARLLDAPRPGDAVDIDATVHVAVRG